MEYKSKYKAEEIEAILDAKNNTGETVDETLDGLFVDALQTKEIELSESAEITPDEGFLGLKKVNVTVKGGGDDTGGGSASTIEYLDVSGIDIKGGGSKGGQLIATCFQMNGEHNAIGKFVLPIGQVYVIQTTSLTSVRYLSFDFASKVIMGGMNMSVKDALIQSGWTDAELAAIPRITKEQFYTI